ncbi:hypothetical protein PORY_001329 [Pneumocystis oryctolagi]|uniref:Uncharacterized protein n=1 Tax=Pneumocystis oryctolagi TaxID=42067 RepID=A0ACB7CE60_9ASCO|nr:hypothetical protein PORY_001329 [Pneumocystis oryctolagi]
MYFLLKICIFMIAFIERIVGRGNLGFCFSTIKLDGKCKTTSDYLDEISLIKGQSAYVRLFSAGNCNSMEEIMPAIASTGIKVVLGVWLDNSSDQQFENEKRILKTHLLKYSIYIYAITVGSESLYRKDYSDDTLANKILDVRLMLNGMGISNIKVGTADTWNVFADGTAVRVIQASDVIFINTFPYWQGVSIEDSFSTFIYSVSRAIEVIRIVKHNMEVWVGETGWPTDGDVYGNSVPSLESASYYWKKVICTALYNNLNIFVFELKDEPWKGNAIGLSGQSSNVEKFWGVFTLDGEKKYSLECPKELIFEESEISFVNTMGVKYLMSFLRRFAPNSIKKVTGKELRYKTLAIDGTLLIRRGFASPWISTADKFRHIVWALYLARICRFYKVTPIIIFDGQHSTPAKMNEKTRRLYIKENNRKLLAEKIRQATHLKNLLEISYEMSKLNTIDRESINLFLKKVIQTYNQFKYNLSDLNFYENDLGIKLHIWMKNELFSYRNGSFLVEKLLNRIVNYIYDIFLYSTSELMSELSMLVNLSDPCAIDMFRNDLEKRQVSMNILVQKLSRRLSSPTWKQISQTKTIFKILGIKVLTFPGYEAEAVASSLVNNGIADFVVTEDTDTLLFNAKMLRGFMSMKNLANKNCKFPFSSNMYVIDPIDIRSSLGNISINSFIDFGILCGTDFCNTIYGLGCFGAFFLIQKYKSIELVLENLSKFKTKRGKQKYIAPENYIQEVQIAREAFMHIPHVRFLDHKLIAPGVPWFDISENDWERLENSVIEKYKLNISELSFFRQFLVNREKNDGILENTLRKSLLYECF